MNGPFHLICGSGLSNTEFAGFRFNATIIMSGMVGNTCNDKMTVLFDKNTDKMTQLRLTFYIIYVLLSTKIAVQHPESRGTEQLPAKVIGYHSVYYEGDRKWNESMF